MRLILLAVAVSLAAGCASSSSAPAPPIVVSVAGESQGKDSTALRVGQDLQVRLRSQAGTGYSWDLAGGDGGAVAFRNRTNERDGDTESAPGAAVWETFNFRARSPGQAVLKFAYRRPWEKSAAPARSFELSVTVAQ